MDNSPIGELKIIRCRQQIIAVSPNWWIFWGHILRHSQNCIVLRSGYDSSILLRKYLYVYWLLSHISTKKLFLFTLAIGNFAKTYSQHDQQTTFLNGQSAKGHQNAHIIVVVVNVARFIVHVIAQLWVHFPFEKRQKHGQTVGACCERYQTGAPFKWHRKWASQQTVSVMQNKYLAWACGWGSFVASST